MSDPIKSRPRYAGLEPVPSARRNLVVVDTDGARAAHRLLDGAPPGFAGRTEVLVTGAAQDALGDLAGTVDAFDAVGAVLVELSWRLSTATMGTWLYAAGSEGLIGQVVRVGAEHGVDPRSVLTEHVGSLARRVQCVHCKVTTDSVTATPYTCPGCDRPLLVRDHYSARLAAFQGVCVNAEDPGEQPEAAAAFA